MPLNNIQIKQLKILGFKFRNKNRYTLLTKFGQFWSIRISREGFYFELDGSLLKSEPLSFDEVIKVVKILFPDEERQRIRIIN